MFAGRHILLGVSGGVAVYRVAELARLLQKAGARISVVMSRAACQFVTPLTFEAITGEAVHTELFDLTREREMGHIQLARRADAVLLAPATANLLAHLAHGIADDLLTTVMQVNEAPVLIAPAMNRSMWASAATQANVEQLKSAGYRFIEPTSGALACGEQGVGRLAELEQIMDALQPLLIDAQPLAGQHWVINAGPTAEAWDGVRLLTNRATGRLGVALAERAALLGAAVTLIAGPGVPATSTRIRREHITSAIEMLQRCIRAATRADLFIGTAAVSDYRFAENHAGKLKRGDNHRIRVELTANPDIIAHIATMPDRPTRVVAFAAESCDHVTHARQKLEKKHVDAIIANDISNMGSDTASGWWITKATTTPIEAMDKPAFAAAIIEQIIATEREKDAVGRTEP